MSLRAGATADQSNAISAYKISDDEKFLGGLALTGFGTKPIPGAICDDAIQRVVSFSAHHIQRILVGLIERQVEDMAYAQEVLSVQLGKANDSINYISQKTGQGLYVGGVICYAVGWQYICLPFGGCRAYLWDGETFQLQKNKTPPYIDDAYIYDALGGGNVWTATFDSGTLAVGSHLLCMTHPPQEGTMEKALATLSATDPQLVADNIYAGITRNTLPTALLAIHQAAG